MLATKEFGRATEAEFRRDVFVFILLVSLFFLRYLNSQVEVPGLTCKDILIY